MARPMSKPSTLTMVERHELGERFLLFMHANKHQAWATSDMEKKLDVPRQHIQLACAELTKSQDVWRSNRGYYRLRGVAG